jgi:hypothetical protein
MELKNCGIRYERIRQNIGIIVIMDVFPECLALWEPDEVPAPRGSERLLSNAQQLSDKLSLLPWVLGLPRGQVFWKV